MGQIIAFSYPIELILEHNDNVVDTYEDEWGTYNIFSIGIVRWTEKAGLSWLIVVEHPGSGKSIEQLVTPHESGFENLPTPIRFNSYPLTVHCSLRRA